MYVIIIPVNQENICTVLKTFFVAGGINMINEKRNLDVENLGINLKRYREAAALSVKEFSEKISTSGRSVYDWEKGKKYPTLEHFVNILKLYDISINDILS